MNEKPNFAGLDVAKYFHLDISPLRGHYDGPLSPRCLNAFFALPQELQPLFFAGLKKAHDLLPTEIAQAAKFMKRLSSDPLVRETAMGAIADNFAELLDPDFRQKQGMLIGSSPEMKGIKCLREIFYEMTVNADQDYLGEALDLIPKQIQA